MRSLPSTIVPDGRSGVSVFPIFPNSSVRFTLDTYPSSVVVASINTSLFKTCSFFPKNFIRITIPIIAITSAMRIATIICIIFAPASIRLSTIKTPPKIPTIPPGTKNSAIKRAKPTINNNNVSYPAKPATICPKKNKPSADKPIIPGTPNPGE